MLRAREVGAGGGLKWRGVGWGGGGGGVRGRGGCGLFLTLKTSPPESLPQEDGQR